jgi:hypothetical protein
MARYEVPAISRGSNGASVYRWIATFLLGIVLSQALSWATYVRGAVTKNEVSEQIRVESPYVQDKEAIRVQLQMIQQAQRDQSEKIGDIQQQLTHIGVAVGVEPTGRPQRRR